MKVGDRVKCIDDEPIPGYIWTGDKPVIGQEYTIIGFGSNTQFTYKGPVKGTTLFFKEIKNNMHGKSNDVGYYKFRFRPAIKGGESTGYSVLEDIRKRESIDDNVKVKRDDLVKERG